ncbi:hypothetical protein [Occultella gossypii]|uniref:ATP synthase F0 subunit B n=1 Tax=Occultella gossypii TaxID=2800820 RepID=A0ABS7S3D7_9MICO|nr:hypothetical protein [Occultella gossypii]MBZ2194812.1 hypothetical protein [Occultella gossypii]
MTDQNRPYEPSAGTSDALPPTYPPDPGTTPLRDAPAPSADDQGSAKEEVTRVASEAGNRAQDVKDVATEQARDVARTARDQVKDSAAEARYQARSLFEQARREVTDQADGQQQRLAGGLRSFSSELSSMADGSQEQGLAGTVTRQVADYLERAGDWLEQRDPAQTLDEVSRYARRHPGTFIAIAAGLGVLVGRVARSAKDASDDDQADTGRADTGRADTGRADTGRADTAQPTGRAAAGPVRRSVSVERTVVTPPSTGAEPASTGPAGSAAAGIPDWRPVGGATGAPLSTPPGGAA